MIEKDSLFYMANMYPEIGRLFRAHSKNKRGVADNARDRALIIADSILACSDLSIAGKEEWFTFRNLIQGYETLDVFEWDIVQRYAEPFSYKFMSRYAM